MSAMRGAEMPEVAQARALPAVLHDRYRLGEPIGRGGASVVLRARDELLGRDVAVKVFTARATEPGDLRAQEAEARMLAAMNHHGLVTLLDAGIDLTVPEAPQVYLVLELVEGADLRTALRSGPLRPLDVAYLGFDLAGAIGYVHEHGIIHRDVKPANVLVSGLGTDRPRGKLADFGIALLRAASTRPQEQTTGTAAYLSPEQVEGAPLGPATDVYSLGLVLLECLTGHPAYTGAIVEAALARLEHAPGIPDAVPADLAALIRAMTANDPTARPTPGEVELAFRRMVIDRLEEEGGGRARIPEAERLAALRRYDLLDTPPDGGFDRIVSVAARTAGMPVAAVALADSGRLWFKSRIGIACAELALPLDGVPSGGLLPRPTVLQDGGGAAHPLPPVARDAGLATVVGVPLLTTDGVNLGVLLVADRRPAAVDRAVLATLEDLAALVVHEMELRLAVRRAVRLHRD
ncbi:serine/threonine protein kinase [Amnibacterium setariae]|uniref:non-specific serine/threonine protein kinase n=2 Tax=Amnibacterium setariae TaxID=2306585 RepID=A0A3A1U6C9_9MICO|nr:serine/threonine protein kinase [Amnibacterium setariae]